MTAGRPGSGRGVHSPNQDKERIAMNSISQAPAMPAMRRLATAAFVFFLVKGLLWLAAPFVFYFLV
jgi:hypothetical protein